MPCCKICVPLQLVLHRGNEEKVHSTWRDRSIVPQRTRLCVEQHRDAVGGANQPDASHGGRGERALPQQHTGLHPSQRLGQHQRQLLLAISHAVTGHCIKFTILCPSKNKPTSQYVKELTSTPALCRRAAKISRIIHPAKRYFSTIGQTSQTHTKSERKNFLSPFFFSFPALLKTFCPEKDPFSSLLNYLDQPSLAPGASAATGTAPSSSII